ncbi:unknown [Bacteroides sp. CAG:1060]|nr:unknown [Bacteroides sp. CAG:1060]
MFACKHLRSGQRPVASDYNQGVNSEILDILVSLLAPFYSAKLLTSCGLQNSAATLDGVADTLCGKFLDVSTYQTFPASVDAEDFPTLIYSSSGDRPDAGIHSRGIPARSKYSNCLDFHNGDKYITFLAVCCNVCAFLQDVTLNRINLRPCEIDKILRGDLQL